MKKQAAKKSGGVAATAPAPSAKPAPQASKGKDISESSDKYTDEDFESISKSQSASLPNAPKVIAPSSAKIAQPPSRISTFVRTANKLTMTDQTKFNFMDANTGGITSGQKEWGLKRNLEDAEMLIQEMRHEQADHKEEIMQLEEKMKKTEMEYKTARRESLNMQETNNRLKEQLKDYMHKINLYKIETEDLIKQIDLADAKTREKEDELRLMEAEYDRKMKLQEERILMRRSKNENREAYELKRNHSIQVEELNNKLTEKEEELDYYKQKVEKLEVEN